MARRPRVAGLTPAAQRAARPDAPHSTAFGEDPLADPAGSEQVSPARTPAAAPEEAPATDAPAVETGPAGGKPTGVVPAGDEPAAAGPAAPAGAPAGKSRRRPSPRRGQAGPASGSGEPAAAAEEVPAGDPAGAGSRVAGLRPHAVALLAVALVVLTGLAVLFGVLDARLRGTPTATNTALVDVGATAEAASQLSDALETVYSFDFTRLDENERAAGEAVTPAFATDFHRLFGEIRKYAPEQQAVVSATVALSAMKEITGDRAVMVAFLNQQGTKAAGDPAPQQIASEGMLTVTGERVDGHWKIAAVEPH